MESIPQEDILFILKLLEDSKFDDLHLEAGNVKLIARKHGRGETPAEERGSVGLEKRGFEGGESMTEARSPVAETREIGPTETPLLAADEPEGTAAIKAPMLGTFYRTPKPGAPPFVKVGQRVTEDDVVCIIEVMKLFNTVKAGVRGKIVKIFAENAQMVEFQQPLFLVEKTPEGEEPMAPRA